MAWSTRELAERAGTTVNTIRHYHRLGLLDEPEREENGYKQYQVHHLVSLLRIRRLADLGVPLTQIGAVRADADGAPQLLRELDAELAENIRRLKKARSDIAALLRDDAPADTPVGFEPVAGRMSESDLSIVHIYTRLYDDAALADIRVIAEDTDGVAADLDALTPDAPEDERRPLVDRLARSLARSLREYPWLDDPASHRATRSPLTSETMIEAVLELYNPAQLDVLERAHRAARAQMHRGQGDAPSE